MTVPVCLSCGLSDRVEKVTDLIAAANTSDAPTRDANVDRRQVAKQLSLHLKQPKAPPGCTPIISGFGMGVIMLALSQFPQYVGGDDNASWLFILSIGIMTLFIMLSLAFLVSGGAYKEQEIYEKTVARRKRALEIWDRLFYCYRCKGVFLHPVHENEKSELIPIDMLPAFLEAPESSSA